MADISTALPFFDGMPGWVQFLGNAGIGIGALLAGFATFQKMYKGGANEPKDDAPKQILFESATISDSRPFVRLADAADKMVKCAEDANKTAKASCEALTEINDMMSAYFAALREEAKVQAEVERRVQQAEDRKNRSRNVV